jgi:SAM-dependent methyltransferase
MYKPDLAYIHDAGFSSHARRMAPGLLALLRDAGLARGLVVDAGCGSGVLTRMLLNAGYDVLGIDISPAMIRLARRRAPEASYRVASLDRIDLPRATAVLAIGEIVSYLCSPTAVMRFFRNASAALDRQGLLLFDFLESSRGRTYAHRERHGCDWRIALSAGLDGSGRVLTRRMRLLRLIGGRIRTSQENHRIHIYARAEIQTLLCEAGFQAIFRRSVGSYRLPSADLVAIARRV